MAAKAKGKQPMVCEEVDEPLSVEVDEPLRDEEEEETDDDEETVVEEETDDEGAPLKASTGKRKRQVITYTEVERLPATESMDAARFPELQKVQTHTVARNQNRSVRSACGVQVRRGVQVSRAYICHIRHTPVLSVTTTIHNKSRILFYKQENV